MSAIAEIVATADQVVGEIMTKTQDIAPEIPSRCVARIVFCGDTRLKYEVTPVSGEDIPGRLRQALDMALEQAEDRSGTKGGSVSVGLDRADIFLAATKAGYTVEWDDSKAKLPPS